VSLSEPIFTGTWQWVSQNKKNSRREGDAGKRGSQNSGESGARCNCTRPARKRGHGQGEQREKGVVTKPLAKKEAKQRDLLLRPRFELKKGSHTRVKRSRDCKICGQQHRVAACGPVARSSTRMKKKLGKVIGRFGRDSGGKVSPKGKGERVSSMPQFFLDEKKGNNAKIRKGGKTKKEAARRVDPTSSRRTVTMPPKKSRGEGKGGKAALRY